MPTTIGKPRQSFVQHLPAPVRGLIEAVLPQNEIPMPTPLVAGVPPSQISALKEYGKRMVERLRREGMPSFEEFPISQPHNPLDLSHLKTQQYEPIPEPLMQALEFAQQRHPRLFGHVRRITNVPVEERKYRRGIQEAADISGNSLRSIFSPPSKFSNLSYNTKQIEGKPFARVVGHELLHATDQLTDLDFPEKYDFSLRLPGGYKSSARELRANLAGEQLEQKMIREALRKAGTK